MGEEEEEERESSDVEEDDDEPSESESESEEKWRKHYSSKQRILLVGEGDFSFSLCLATHFGSARNMVATSLDSQGTSIGFLLLLLLLLFCLKFRCLYYHGSINNNRDGLNFRQAM